MMRLVQKIRSLLSTKVFVSPTLNKQAPPMERLDSISCGTFLNDYDIIIFKIKTAGIKKPISKEKVPIETNDRQTDRQTQQVWRQIERKHSS